MASEPQLRTANERALAARLELATLATRTDDPAAAEILVESDVAACESEQAFRERLFVWKDIMALARDDVGRRPLYCSDHLTLEDLQQSLREKQRGVILFSYGPADRRAVRLAPVRARG